MIHIARGKNKNLAWCAFAPARCSMRRLDMSNENPTHRLQRRLARATSLLLLLAPLAACLPARAYEDWPSPPLVSPPYSAQAITGKVVDAETGEPLAGVIIVAQWMIDRKFVGDDKALLNVMETVSDSEGNYGFPAWGPISLPPMADFRKGEDPRVYYFKTGYWPEVESNGVVSDISYRITPVGGFKGNGKTVKLRKWDGKDVREYYLRVDGMASDMPHESGLEWKKYPRLTVAVETIHRRLLQQPGFPKNVAIPFIRGLSMNRLSEEDRDYLKRFEQ